MAGYHNGEDFQEQKGQSVSAIAMPLPILRLQPEHPAKFINLTRHRSRNSISFAGFQGIFRVFHISLSGGNARVSWTQLLWAESLPATLVQAAPVGAHEVDYFNQALLGARRADAGSNLHVPNLLFH
jgi:hypothetical protein